MRRALALLVLAMIAACGDDASKDMPPSTVDRLCERLDRCGLLAEDSDVAECADVLEDCAQGFDGGARGEWENAVDECLIDDACGALEQCYLDAPGC